MKQKQKAKQPAKKTAHPSRYKWDKGEYARDQDIKIIFPWQFLYLCKLTGVTPDEVLDHFMNDLGQESWKRNKNEGVRVAAIEYFIQCGYGQGFYSESEIRQMFKELDAIGMLWPDKGSSKLIDRHARWRNKYYDHWFKQWYYKIRKKKL